MIMEVNEVTTLRDLIECVQHNYVNESQNKEFRQNELANLIRHGLEQVIEPGFFDSNTRLYGSAGSGRWSLVPWFGVFDRRISDQAVRGFYLVYLFSADMKDVYLSLNQGWSQYQTEYGKDARKAVRAVSAYWRATIVNKSEQVSDGEISLVPEGYKQSTSLPEGYENGNIYSIHYSIDNLPSQTVLMNDLYIMYDLLKNLREHLLSPDNAKRTISMILELSGEISEPTIDHNIGEKEATPPYLIKESTDSLNLNSRIKKEGQPSRTPRESKTDFDKIHSKNKQLGDCGELLVMEYERNKLIGAGQKLLAEKVKHISFTRGDGAGYDIESFDEGGNPMFIEVKTTNNAATEPFFISRNELKASKQYEQNYSLYRLYRPNGDKSQDFRFFEIKGDLSQHCKLVPQNFRATFKADNSTSV